MAVRTGDVPRKLEDVIDLNMSILVVDDSDTMRRIITTTLKEIGLTNVTKADDGESAWQKLQKQDFDLILSDHKMPKMSGEELLERVRQSERHKRIPFIMITAEAFHENVMKAVKLGVSNYIVKPFNPQQLLEKILKVFPAPPR